MVRSYVAAVVAIVGFVVPVAAQSVDEVIARGFAAQGGVVRLKAVQSVRMTGQMKVGPGMEAPVVVEVKRPKMMRLDISVQKTTIVQAFDGTNGWIVNPLTGSSDAQPIPPEMARIAEKQADMDGPLMDYREKGNTVELTGRAQADGTECFKVKLTEPDGDVTVFFIDVKTYFTVRQESRRTVGGREIETVTILGDWKAVDGVMFAHTVETGQAGNPDRQTMTMSTIELNVPIDDARFRMPRQ
jgi:outer membrane lipoprotein-sorting protein